MILQIDNGNDIQQLNTDLLVNKMSAEDYKEVINKIQNDEPLTVEQHHQIVGANILTPVRQIDLTYDDILLPGKATVQSEEVPEPSIFPEKTIVEVIPAPVVKKKLGFFDSITNYIYNIIYSKK